MAVTDPLDEPWTAEELADDQPSRPVSVWRIAAGVALGAVAAAIIVVPAATLWNEMVLKPNIDSLPSDVKSSLENSLRSDDTYSPYNLTVGGLVLIKTGENTYTGTAEIRPANRESHEIGLTVYYDGDRMMWNTAPGAFLWLTSGS